MGLRHSRGLRQAKLEHLVRDGKLDRRRLHWAARFGDPAAAALMARRVAAVDELERDAAILEAARNVAGRAWRRLIIAFAADCAERCLPVYSRHHPGDDRLLQAVEAMRGFARSDPAWRRPTVRQLYRRVFEPMPEDMPGWLPAAVAGGPCDAIGQSDRGRFERSASLAWTLGAHVFGQDRHRREVAWQNARFADHLLDL